MNGQGPSGAVNPGDILAGKYRIDRVLGEGGMGVVVAAHHIQLDERVAIKFLLPAALKNAEAVSRFVRESRTAVKIKSEHVVRVTDVGQLESGAPYMVMEYLEGGDLARWLQERGALPIEQAVEFLLQTCEAVADAHALGVVHRDLKPANLFCVRLSDGTLSIKVIDFGISKLTRPGELSDGPSVTKTSAVMGTPLYMSPEQMKSAKSVDARADIWALGVILFELLAGRCPFLADTMMELVARISTEAPPPVRMFRPDVPPALEATIVRCLAREPSDRFQNVAELAVAVAPFATRRGRVSVERISGILQAAGLSASALALPLSPGVAPAPVPPTASSGAVTGAGGTLPILLVKTNPEPTGRGAAVAAGLFGALVVVGVVGVGAVRLLGKSAADPPVVAPPDVVAAVAPPPSSPGVAPPPSASAAASSPPTVAASPAPSNPGPRTAASHPTSPPMTAPPPTPPQPSHAPSHPSVNCEVPFTIDAKGHRVPRTECM